PARCHLRRGTAASRPLAGPPAGHGCGYRRRGREVGAGQTRPAGRPRGARDSGGAGPSAPRAAGPPAHPGGAVSPGATAGNRAYGRAAICIRAPVLSPRDARGALSIRRYGGARPPLPRNHPGGVHGVALPPPVLLRAEGEPGDGVAVPWILGWPGEPALLGGAAGRLVLAGLGRSPGICAGLDHERDAPRLSGAAEIPLATASLQPL